MIPDIQFEKWRALSQNSTLENYLQDIYSTIRTENLIPKAAPNT